MQLYTYTRSHLGVAVKRSSSHKANDGGTIGVSNKGALPHPYFDSFHGLRVYFWDHKWHLLVHPKGRAIVHHNAPLLNCNRTKLLADGPSRAEQRNIDAVKAVGSELLHNVVPVLEGHVLASGALGGKHLDGAVGKVSVGENGEELLPDGAGDTNDSKGRRGFLEGHAYSVGRANGPGSEVGGGG